MISHMAAEFANRIEAGRALALKLGEFAGRNDILVLALPRGGVPVAYEVAEALKAHLDVLIVRKIGAPRQPELAMGAIASGGGYTVNREVLDEMHVTAAEFGAAVQREWDELHRREQVYRPHRAPIEVANKTVIVVDDGLATGSTMRVAPAALRRLQPARIVVAVPVAPADTLYRLEALADRVICLVTPEPFGAVGVHYMNFGQVGDAEVRQLLEENARRRAA
jgi:putative phosphoribosyl transferase